MNESTVMKPAPSTDQYLSDPHQFAGTENALYERHLIFDNILDLGSAGWRERFEAFARSVRDILSKNWLKTDQTYATETLNGATTSRWSSSSAARSPTT
jgi:hypothetical protein